MSYLITLGLVETIYDPVVDRVKMVLAGATTIKRERVPNEVINELVIFDGTSADDGVGVGGGASAGAGQHEGLPLVDDVLSFSVRSVRNMIKILLFIHKN
ncbi:hypothetical protein EJD97_006018 [Solanum chilense]|uniref:Uncharacterized protein n=1 Tax=Solanum chilense TaxID=4083 RepID=A0A6N2AJB0_SOLCI|nr:hypothetical protein EJD97_006018 [Solanum chilense]